MVDFGGWALPTQYDSILKEHAHVREAAGLFDVSHMGEIAVTGAGAKEFVHSILTNDVLQAQNGQAVYGILCYKNGCAVDDLIAYVQSDSKILLVVNAANDDKDFAYIQSLCPPGIQLEHASARLGQLALQGPKAQEALAPLTNADLASLKSFHFLDGEEVAGIPCCISRTGYTGEDGFELYCAWNDTPALWRALLQVEGVKPIGLGARDTLRFEAKLPLYGHELREDVTPLEAGLSFFVKLDHDFVGRDALAAQKAAGLTRRLCEVELKGRGIPRAGMVAAANGAGIGHVTSGGVAPTLNRPLALAMLDAAFSAPGTQVDLIIRDKPVPAVVGKGMFYKRKKGQE